MTTMAAFFLAKMSPADLLAKEQKGDHTRGVAVFLGVKMDQAGPLIRP